MLGTAVCAEVLLQPDCMPVVMCQITILYWKKGTQEKEKYTVKLLQGL